MKRATIFMAAVLLLCGAGCAGSVPQEPATNTPATTTPEVNAPADGGNGGSSTKLYQSAPYDFSYPSQYVITDRPMTDAERQPYLDQGLDAPLQFSIFATEVRPPGFVGEGPASVHVIQWGNAQRLPLWEWAKRHGAYTGLTAEVEAGQKYTTETFMGRPSVSYEYDGLYGGKARLIALDGTVLQVSADFDGEGGTNMTAFDMILSTLKLAE